ncbi:MAG: serine hydrolase [Streptosporangiaceae bacterium]
MVFGLIFALMAAFVAVVTLSAAEARNDAAVTTPSGLARARISAGSAGSTVARARLNAELAAALRTKVGTGPGTLAVGAIDRATGSMAVYNGGLRFHCGSIVTADILAALLLRYQHGGEPVAAQDASLATEMIEDSSPAAASVLWRLGGGVAGIEAANRVLQLAHTSMGTGGRWDLTSTTAIDQLRLLTDLTSATSPLDAAARAYAVGLMEHVAAGQRWGAPAAATPGTKYAVKSGWLPDPRLLVVNTIGIVRRDGAELLIVVLSEGNPTKAAGIARAEAAAATAAEVVTASRP